MGLDAGRRDTELGRHAANPIADRRDHLPRDRGNLAGRAQVRVVEVERQGSGARILLEALLRARRYHQHTLNVTVSELAHGVLLRRRDPYVHTRRTLEGLGEDVGDHAAVLPHDG